MQVHALYNSKNSNKKAGKKRHPCRLDWAQSSWTRWIHVAFWMWIKPILSSGNQRALVDEDLDELSLEDSCSFSLNRVNLDNQQWSGTWNIIRRTFLKDFILSGAVLLLNIVTRIAQPLLLREIVLYISTESAAPTYGGYLLAVGLGACSALQAIIHQQSFFRSTRIGMHVRHALSSIIYKRLLTINTACLERTSVAQTINLVANDASKFEELSVYMHYLWEAPLEALLVFGFIW
jgi:hypothetical protein